MKKIKISIGLVSNPRTWPILNGIIEPEGIELVPTVVGESHFGLDTIPDFGPNGGKLYSYWPGRVRTGMGRIFDRQLSYGDFDVSEMSMTRLMMSMAKGDDRWIGLPMFMSRRFFHMDILVRKDAGIEKPQDLKGKRVGVGTYQSVPPVWNRGMLQHRYGVHPTEIEWWREKNPDYGHGATAFEPPADLQLHDIPHGQSVSAMLETGELQASLQYPSSRGGGRYGWSHPDVEQLFSDTLGDGVRYYQETGLYPINHGSVIKRSVAERYPWVVQNLFRAFQDAAELADHLRMAYVGYHLETGLLPADAEEALQVPLIRHGIDANRSVLESWVQYAYEQGLTPQRLQPEDLFPDSLRDS